MITARNLAKYLTTEYERGKADGESNIPPDPGMVSSDPGVVWKYEGVRRHMYDKGWQDGRKRYDSSWGRPGRVAP